MCLKFKLALFSGTPYSQQSYKVSESFPFKWINKKWKEGFHVTSMTTAGNRWGVVMSRNAGYSEQVRLGELSGIWDMKYVAVVNLIKVTISEGGKKQTFVPIGFNYS